MRDRGSLSAVAFCNGASQEIVPQAIVVASGGFEANIPWLKEYWDDAADNFIIRGTKRNQGRMLRGSNVRRAPSSCPWPVFVNEHDHATRSRAR